MKTTDWDTTPRGTLQAVQGTGALELNLQPMNSGVQNGLQVGYATVRDDGVLGNSLFDQVGIVGLQLSGCPPVPCICWDNREHQYWDGNEGSYEPRNVIANAPRAGVDDDGSCWASYYYVSQFVKTTVHWRFHPRQRHWDTTITVENLRQQALDNYLQLFACYHRASPNAFWQSADQLQPCDGFGSVGTATAEEADRLRQSPFCAHLRRYAGENPVPFHRYYHPVLLSSPQAWYGDGRHVLLVEPRTCAAIVTWGSQARDYLIRPPSYRLDAGERFTTRIRHHIIPISAATALQPLWDAFEAEVADHAKGG